ncbi:MAG: biotin--[acetyl-CoA-carboxylase] ligase [Nitrospinae bacterium]|nr:biotin--[acetyl-CoA-carboxylase] ligase [Nitrospinota bacterium]MDA1110003.1 biotin--[acetyl-CoA-carboxylase] ligase [Nitrospinota bacterium]
MSNSSPLDAEKIRNDLRPVRLGSYILVFDEIDSTNDLAQKYLEEGALEGLVLIAESQTRGRGRMGRSWVSPPGTGIYMSVLLKPQIQPQRLPQLTLLAGLASVQAINEFSSQKVQLKWPNDILLNGKKLCGILSEYHATQSGESAVIIGIGVNVNHSRNDFPEDLRPIATSLMIETGSPVDRQALATAIIRHLDQEYDAYLQNRSPDVINKWANHSDMFGKKISVTKGKSVIHGTALGLDSEGRLLMRTKSGEEIAFDSGEVSLGSTAHNP